MNRKQWEKKFQTNFEKSLPDSGLDFKTLSDRADFEKYKKGKKKFIWIPVVASILGALVVGVGITEMLSQRGTGGAPAPAGFEFGTYSFETIDFSEGDTSLTKPQSGDVVTVSSKAESPISFQINDPDDGIFYLSIFGSASEYGMIAKETYPNMVIAEFDYEGTLYNADFVRESSTKIRFTVFSTSSSFSAIFAK